ncbi:MAG: UDP-N-acetylmuramoyl-L-alanyl-D-glutamate--2,6-diaminopimelate ligase [Alphaproteobacteria bacterium]|nr:UDP-N-acetylmuramoyl-L-alanyl-D-glutamate--2,6-diaminopimelate ligase [Alphaproteobacteria bacterium]
MNPQQVGRGARRAGVQGCARLLLTELIHLGERVKLEGNIRRQITGLTADSRQVGPGFLFAAIPGSQQDGRAYIPQALAKGALAVLAPPGTELPQGAEAALIIDPEPRRALARMAALFFGQQPETLVAVTGTNGKTSTVTFLRQIWAILGHSAASLGTLGLVGPGHEGGESLTTPDPVALHALLAGLAKEGITHLAMEASSHGLDQFRLDGVALKAAAFTNLTRDHLDYHKDMASYLAAKARLFTELLPEGGVAVLNADIPEFETLRTMAHARRLHVIDYGHKATALRLIEAQASGEGLLLTIELLGKRRQAMLPIAGGFQAMNALAALGLAVATGAHAERALLALESLEAVPGRMQLAVTTSKDASVYVDYAHTPDALETALVNLRPHAKGRLGVVFGCGGDRDRGKRPLMGAVAARQADWAIVTDDNPRTENAASIRQEILAACPNALEIADRRSAIEEALSRLESGDVLLIAGKGHENYQIVGQEKRPFDDVMEARRASDKEAT